MGDNCGNDRNLERLTGTTGKSREFISIYRDIACLSVYADELKRMLFLDASSAKVMKLLDDFIAYLREKVADGGHYSPLSAMINTLENQWDALFYCFDDQLIPRTENGFKITIMDQKIAYRKMTGMRPRDSYIAQYGRDGFRIPLGVSGTNLMTIASDVNMNEYKKRCRDFRSQKRGQPLIRTASNDYTSSLRFLPCTSAFFPP